MGQISSLIVTLPKYKNNDLYFCIIIFLFLLHLYFELRMPPLYTCHSFNGFQIPLFLITVHKFYRYSPLIQSQVCNNLAVVFLIHFLNFHLYIFLLFFHTQDFWLKAVVFLRIHFCISIFPFFLKNKTYIMKQDLAASGKTSTCI